jgi:tRNA-splicing ligase RtcB
MPAKHPDLYGTKWFETGHILAVPGSMFLGAALLMPEPNAHSTACSVNHGSGRLMARGKAKKSLAHKQEFIDKEMHDVSRTFNGVTIEGIIINSKHVPLDESSNVYKDLDQVLAVLTENKLARVVRRLYPVANIKGTD